MLHETRMTAVIPRERVGVLVGHDGNVKSAIEHKLFVDLKVLVLGHRNLLQVECLSLKKRNPSGKLARFS